MLLTAIQLQPPVAACIRIPLTSQNPPSNRIDAYEPYVSTESVTVFMSARIGQLVDRAGQPLSIDGFPAPAPFAVDLLPQTDARRGIIRCGIGSCHSDGPSN